MLESFISLERIEKSPYVMFGWAFVLSSIAFFLSTKVSFKFTISSVAINLSGLFSVIFILLPAAYLLTALIKSEEDMAERDIEKKYKKGFWKRNERDVLIFLFFFFGVAFSFAFWSFFLQPDFFQIQKIEIGRIVGGTGAISGIAVGEISFKDILYNNVGVMILSFIFSLLFGAGVAFIIVWNASLLGVRIAQLSTSLYDIPAKTLPFLPHGIFEITAFVLAGLSGGIISSAIIKERHKTGVFQKILLDAVILFLLASVCVAVGAWIEVQ